MTKILKSPEVTMETLIPLNVPRPAVTVQSLVDIVNYAFEGNVVSYWEVEVTDYTRSAVEINGHRDVYKFTIKDFSTNEKGDLFEVNVDTVKKGIEDILNGNTPVSHRIVEDIRHNLAEGDVAGVDADTVDCIIQQGLFGEFIYG